MNLRYLNRKHRSKSLRSTIEGDGGGPTGCASRPNLRSDGYTPVPYVARAEEDECTSEPTASNEDEMGSIAVRILVMGKIGDADNQH